MQQSVYFEECALCRNGDFPANARLKVNENSRVTCEDIYSDLAALNKSTNKSQCLKKTTQYRSLCCESSGSSFPHSLSTLAGVLLVFGFARRLFSSRRIRTAPVGAAAGPVNDISVDYTNMDDGTKTTRDSALDANNKEGSSGSGFIKGGNKRSYPDDDTLFSFQSTIKSLISTPPHRKNKLQKGRSKCKSKNGRKTPRKEERHVPTQLV